MVVEQSFTPLQSRRLPQPASAASLCPSMDLIALNLGRSPASSVSVHRTVSWQKLLTVPKSDLAAQAASGEEEEGGVGGENCSPDEGKGKICEDDCDSPNGATALCWSPDGRSVAVGLADGGVALYDVESAVDGSQGGGGGSGGGLSTDARYITPAPHMTPVPGRRVRDEPGDELAAAPAGRREGRVPAFTTSPAVTRSKAAAMRRQQTEKNNVDSEVVGVASTATELTKRMSLGWRRNVVTGLVWARVGPKHKHWELEEEEKEEGVHWSYRSHYLDRAKHFLPPCEYSPRIDGDENQPPHHDSSIVVDDTTLSNMDRHRPTSLTPLSVLCVATCANGLHLHLHGRYRVLSIPPSASSCDVISSIVCTSDLSTILLSSKSLPPESHHLSIYSIPSLSRNRYDLQQISALYCSITAHIQTIRRGLDSTSVSWTGALRPLDSKFESLAKLLRDYGVLNASTADNSAAAAAGVRAELLRFVLEGHSSQNGDASNAMDQFFAAAVMNDQLLQRLERTLEANGAGVEGTVRKSVLGPLRALVYDAQELRGLAGTMAAGRSQVWEDDSDEECDASSEPLLDLNTSLRFCDATENLFIFMERCLSMLVDARFRLRDTMKWIRGTASQVKARGTAIDSVMRENARKRRVPDAVVKRVAKFLSSRSLLKSGENGDGRETSLESAKMTEQVIGIPLSIFLSDRLQTVSDTKEFGGFVSPLAPRKTVDGVPIEQIEPLSALPALNTVAHLAADLFEQPRNSISQTVQRIDMAVPYRRRQEGSSAKCSCAVHKRVGAGVASRQTNYKGNCFVPDVTEGDNVCSLRERHWTLFAVSGNSQAQDYRGYVQIVAIPFGRNSKIGNYFLVSSLLFPGNCVVSDVQFYGDDGCSSLSSTKDVDHVGEEGRQSLGILIERDVCVGSQNADTPELQGVSEELCLLPYDKLPYKHMNVSCAADGIIAIPELDPNSDSVTYISERMKIFDSTTGTQNIRLRKIRDWTRNLHQDDSQKSTLVLSGSRGIGGIYSAFSGTVELFDLEEDEEEEEEDRNQFDESGVFIDTSMSA